MALQKHRPARARVTVDVPEVAVLLFAVEQVKAADKLARRTGSHIGMSVILPRRVFAQVAALPGAKAEDGMHGDKPFSRVSVDGEQWLYCWEPAEVDASTTAHAEDAAVAQGVA